MKILIVTPYFDEPYHQFSSSIKLTSGLSSDMEIVVLSGNTEKNGWETRDWGKIFFVKDTITFSDPINQGIPLGIWRHIFKVLKQEKPDLILINHFMFFTASIMILLKLMRYKVAISTDTFIGYNWFPRKEKDRIYVKIYFWLYGSWLLKLADKIIVYHSGNLPAVKKLGLAGKTVVLPYGISREEITNVKPAHDLKKKDKEIWVGFAGRLTAIKGYDDFLTIAQNLAKKHRQLHFIIAGYGPKFKLHCQKNTSDQIHFLGFRKDILSVIKTFDIFVLTSYSEGLPSALMEAMALGKPCVATNVGGICDLVIDQVTGLLTKSGDIKGTSDKIIRLVKSKTLREKLGNNARQHIIKNFLWENLAPKYKKLFASIT
ncbi:MAG: glycosyltransferase [Patescibacteria group bacterium]|nr:glycosyltransferase [Patescibacteria group bacterium]